MFSAYSSCPTTEHPACVPGDYQVLRPAPLDPVRPVALACRLSQLVSRIRESRATAPAPRPAPATDSLAAAAASVPFTPPIG